MPAKSCSACGVTFEGDDLSLYFYRKRSAADGLQHRCKDCCRWRGPDFLVRATAPGWQAFNAARRAKLRALRGTLWFLVGDRVYRSDRLHGTGMAFEEWAAAHTDFQGV
jgi:hypothetical protein